MKVLSQDQSKWYDQGQEDLLEACRFFALNLLSSDEIGVVADCLKSSKNLSEADRKLLPKIIEHALHQSKVSADILMILDTVEIMNLYQIISNGRKSGKYKDQVKKIIGEIGIDELYEIINELDGKGNGH